MKTADFLRHEMNRRQFLGSSAKNAAAGVAAGVVALGASAIAKASPGERVALGVIGVRNQGKVLATGFAGLPDADVTAVCDVDEDLLPAAVRAVEEVQGFRPRRETDFRRLLDDSSLDAVVIATPDHWHAAMTVLACRAGKDVYVETPVSHALREGEEMLAAARSTGRVVQTGLQQRSAAHFRSAVEYVRGGKLGDVRLAKAWTVHRRKPIGFKKDAAAPEGVDYDLWLGPAPERPFNPNRFHYNWHWFWDYGSGELGNWGVHMLDVARWGLGVELPTRVSSTGGKYCFHDDQETPDTQVVTYSFSGSDDGRANSSSLYDGRASSSSPPYEGGAGGGQTRGKTIVWEHRLWHTHGIEGRSTAAAFYGEHGTLIVDRGGWKVYDTREPAGAEVIDQPTDHYRDFLDAVRTRHEPNASLATGLASSTLCHLGNIAYRLGREVVFDPATGLVPNDAQAAGLLAGNSREPWGIIAPLA